MESSVVSISKYADRSRRCIQLIHVLHKNMLRQTDSFELFLKQLSCVFNRFCYHDRCGAYGVVPAEVCVREDLHEVSLFLVVRASSVS